MRQSLAFRIVIAAGLALVGAAFYPFWKALLFGAVVAGAMDAVNVRLTRWLGGRQALAAGLLTMAILLLVLLPVGGVVALAVQQALSGIEWVRGVIEEHGGLDGIVGVLPHPLSDWARSAAERLPKKGWADGLAGGGRWAATQLGALFSASSQALFQMAMALVAIFLFLVEGRALVERIVEMSPLGRERTRELLSELRAVSRAVLVSTIATATIQGLLALVGFALAGVPHAVFFGLLTWFAAFAPGGTAIISLPLVGLLFFTGHPYAAVFLLIWALGVVGLVDNVVKPLIARGGIRLHAGILFLAFLGGLITWGMVGVLLGPLAVSFFLAVARMSARLGKADAAPDQPTA